MRGAGRPHGTLNNTGECGLPGQMHTERQSEHAVPWARQAPAGKDSEGGLRAHLTQPHPGRNRSPGQRTGWKTQRRLRAGWSLLPSSPGPDAGWKKWEPVLLSKQQPGEEARWAQRLGLGQETGRRAHHTETPEQRAKKEPGRVPRAHQADL